MKKEDDDDDGEGGRRTENKTDGSSVMLDLVSDANAILSLVASFALVLLQFPARCCLRFGWICWPGGIHRHAVGQQSRVAMFGQSRRAEWHVVGVLLLLRHLDCPHAVRCYAWFPRGGARG